MPRYPRVASDPLCVTFNRLSEQIWDDLADARRLGTLYDEETATNRLLLDAQRAHRGELVVIPIHKKEEAFVGADWEWWLADNKRNEWVGMLVQAKKLNWRTDKYTKIKHKINGKSQIDILLAAAAVKKIPALYFFYNHTKLEHLPWNCQGGDFYRKQLGCTVAHAAEVKSLLGSGGAGIARVGTVSLPLRCLVCCKERSGQADTLPERVSGAIGALPVIGPSSFEADKELIRGSPPEYVLDILRAGADERADFVTEARRQIADQIREKVGPVRNIAIVVQSRSRSLLKV